MLSLWTSKVIVLLFFILNERFHTDIKKISSFLKISTQVSELKKRVV